MPARTYNCDVDAEPLHRYQPGGYHPLALGDFLKNGRYKILHKLGWGSYSTTWAARDQKRGRYVAVKITISELGESGELKILRALSALSRHDPGWSHVNQMLDHFTLVGPNGSHDCLVLELVGPNVADVVEAHCQNNRLPAKLAKLFAKQVLQGLDFLAANDIGHGDVHTRNLALVAPNLDDLGERDFIAKLGKPETGVVTRSDVQPFGYNVPTQIVRPAFFRRDILLSCPSVKIIDFGEAFFSDNAPSTLHTPLPVRAPEIVFGDRLDRRVDLWSAGCLIFELVTGQPPFDVVMMTPSILIEQMIELTDDELPSRWQAKWQPMQNDTPQRDENYTLHKWLEEVYFDNGKQAEFTKEEIARIAELTTRMLKFEPCLRAAPSEILAEDWLR
ncbi:hypothetical protein EsDP_00004571 [Epichloe bromicola]|uniref:non-specific serine/threonine protein kinase n=1 Tax=Epichloe bromicola TaxID=79588 RepID=A0ABQ0CS46_9HYPO